MAAIGNATRHGFLVREGDALERLAKVKRVGFDKTGTLTVGVPKVVDVISLHADFTKEQIYAYAAAAGITIPQSVGQTLSAQLDKGRTLVHNCGSVFVIINSAFLLSWQWSADSTK